MRTYKFILTANLYAYSYELLEVYFSNDWLLINDGNVFINKGYNWNGCTLAPNTSATYVASCVHDACYQFKIDKSKSDLAFYDLLKQNKFPFAKIYYISVRLFGFIFY